MTSPCTIFFTKIDSFCTKHLPAMSSQRFESYDKDQVPCTQQVTTTMTPEDVTTNNNNNQHLQYNYFDYKYNPHNHPINSQIYTRHYGQSFQHDQQIAQFLTMVSSSSTTTTAFRRRITRANTFPQKFVLLLSMMYKYFVAKYIWWNYYQKNAPTTLTQPISQSVQNNHNIISTTSDLPHGLLFPDQTIAHPFAFDSVVIEKDRTTSKPFLFFSPENTMEKDHPNNSTHELQSPAPQSHPNIEPKSTTNTSLYHPIASLNHYVHHHGDFNLSHDNNLIICAVPPQVSQTRSQSHTQPHIESHLPNAIGCDVMLLDRYQYFFHSLVNQGELKPLTPCEQHPTTSTTTTSSIDVIINIYNNLITSLIGPLQGSYSDLEQIYLISFCNRHIISPLSEHYHTDPDSSTSHNTATTLYRACEYLLLVVNMLWTMKEAIVKAIGVGFLIPPSSIDTSRYLEHIEMQCGTYFHDGHSGSMNTDGEHNVMRFVQFVYPHLDFFKYIHLLVRNNRPHQILSQHTQQENQNSDIISHTCHPSSTHQSDHQLALGEPCLSRQCDIANAFADFLAEHPPNSNWTLAELLQQPTPLVDVLCFLTPLQSQQPQQRVHQQQPNRKTYTISLYHALNVPPQAHLQLFEQQNFSRPHHQFCSQNNNDNNNNNNNRDESSFSVEPVPFGQLFDDHAPAVDVMLTLSMVSFPPQPHPENHTIHHHPLSFFQQHILSDSVLLPHIHPTFSSSQHRSDLLMQHYIITMCHFAPTPPISQGDHQNQYSQQPCAEFVEIENLLQFLVPTDPNPEVRD